MPCDMAVKGPGPWIIGFECDGDEATLRQQDNVAAGGIIVFGSEGVIAEFLIGLLEESEVMTVKMHLICAAQGLAFGETINREKGEGGEGGGASIVDRFFELTGCAAGMNSRFTSLLCDSSAYIPVMII